MAESPIHHRLVSYLKIWVEDTFSEYKPIPLWIDSPKEDYRQKPPIINGHIPDVLYRFKNSSIEVIGEAETLNMLKYRSVYEHAEEQLKAFLEACVVNNCYLVVAVPLEIFSYTKNFVNSLKRECKAERVKIFIPKIAKY